MNALELRATFALSSIFALRMLGLFMIIPVFSVAGQDYLGATPTLIGLAVGIYGLSQAIFQIPFSLWADRFDRKKLIILGLLLFSIGAMIAACSDHIYGVIFGRMLAGMGAVSAVVMALLSDITREEQRSKAMATVGMSIGVSFVVAFGVSPWITEQIGINGLFWLTGAMGLCAIGVLYAIPSVQRYQPIVAQNYREQLKAVLKMPDLNRLHISIFILHLLLAAMFIYMPSQLISVANFSLESHGWIYLPLLILGLLVAFPAIILAEKYRKMRGIMIFSVLAIVGSFTLLAGLATVTWILFLALALFFIAFNILEALLPSWLSKSAPIQSKATAMGINASSQFLGAFLGSVIGGQILLFEQSVYAWGVLAGIAILWLAITLGITQPRYLSTLVIRVEHFIENRNDFMRQLLAINGVEEVVLMPDNNVVYLKVERKQIDENAKRILEQYLQQKIKI